MISDKLKLVNDNVPKVYEAGKKSQYDEFWDSYQNNGKRINYGYGFAGRGWNDINFKPKYKIAPVSTGDNPSSSMFRHTNITDLRQCKMDLIGLKDASYLFQYSSIRYIPEIDLSNATEMYYMCQACWNLIRIEKIIVNAPCRYESTFSGDSKLEHLIFEGNIQNTQRYGLDLHWSTKLDKESILSIINCLNKTEINLANNKCILSKVAVDKTFETSIGVNDGSTSQEWLNLIATKPNWTISLV